MGSRPLPTKAFSTPPPPRKNLPSSAVENVPTLRSQDASRNSRSSAIGEPHPPCPGKMFGQKQDQLIQDHSVRSRTSAHRPIARPPSQNHSFVRGRKVSSTALATNPSSRSSSGSYHESRTKRLERDEAVSLRAALEEIDQQTEEAKLHTAAQDEAAELVWRHRNPKVATESDTHPAYANPDLQSAFRCAPGSLGGEGKKSIYCKPSLASSAERAQLIHSHSYSPSSSGSEAVTSRKPLQDNRCPGAENGTNNNVRNNEAQDAPLYQSTRRANNSVTDGRGAKLGRRKLSGSRSSSGSNFPHGDDRIYEDAGKASDVVDKAENPHAAPSLPLRPINRNSIRGARPLPPRAVTADGRPRQHYDRFEIHKNPPSQSHGAEYTRNSLTPSVEAVLEVETPPMKDGMEIRGEDIRAATSMRRRDRSPKLPTPTAVTDCPERPIASFDPSWQPPSGDSPQEELALLDRPGPRPVANGSNVAASAPVVPTISVQEEGVAKPSIPVIKTCDDDHNDDGIDVNGTIQGSEPVPAAPTLVTTSGRPLPRPSSTMPNKLPTMNSASRLSCLNPKAGVVTSGVSCTNCALPIAGRVVTAAGAGAASSSLKGRFHPECFTCYHCSAGLECVAFYPEPEDKRNERLEKQGASPNGGLSLEGELRFYCHLDFHELFSPRCKNCKTPIEGKVVIAAGAEWHPGHFFCSECGDPFDASMPFVEKDNYAYCVPCHTRRTSARCRACKKQILDDTTVQALGTHWHADCFNCYECGGGFGEDGRFFVRDVTVEGTEKEKRRGIATRTEERAVCEACEERRLKA